MLLSTSATRRCAVSIARELLAILQFLELKAVADLQVTSSLALAACQTGPRRPLLLADSAVRRAGHCRLFKLDGALGDGTSVNCRSYFRAQFNQWVN